MQKTHSWKLDETANYAEALESTEAWKHIAVAETCKQQKQGSIEVADLWNHVSSSNSSTTWKQQIYG